MGEGFRTPGILQGPLGPPGFSLFPPDPPHIIPSVKWNLTSFGGYAAGYRQRFSGCVNLVYYLPIWLITRLVHSFVLTFCLSAFFAPRFLLLLLLLLQNGLLQLVGTKVQCLYGGLNICCPFFSLFVISGSFSFFIYITFPVVKSCCMINVLWILLNFQSIQAAYKTGWRKLTWLNFMVLLTISENSVLTVAENVIFNVNILHILGKEVLPVFMCALYNYGFSAYSKRT